MKLDHLIEGFFLKRYKRFLTDIRLKDGSIITAHCPNSGRMTTCMGDDWPVMLSHHDSPTRKLKYTLEMIYNGKTWITVNTNRANELAFEAINSGNIPEIQYPDIQREKKYSTNSRIDILAQNDNKKCYIEVKSVTLLNQQGQYTFPDAPTERGRKHLTDLMAMIDEGHRAVMLFVVMREDGTSFIPARDIDPAYADLLQTAVKHGVECLAYQARITPTTIAITHKLTTVL